MLSMHYIASLMSVNHANPSKNSPVSIWNVANLVNFVPVDVLARRDINSYNDDSYFRFNSTKNLYLNTIFEAFTSNSIHQNWHTRPRTGWVYSAFHSQTTPSAPSHPLRHPRTGLTPLTCVCWQINSILANIGHRNSIQILNQYPFWWNILIWA